MDLYIITHETIGDVTSNTVYTVVGGYRNYTFATRAYNLYLDALEAQWRDEGEVAVFNRFSEPANEILSNAEVGSHRVYLVRTQLDEGVPTVVPV